LNIKYKVTTPSYSRQEKYQDQKCQDVQGQGEEKSHRERIIKYEKYFKNQNRVKNSAICKQLREDYGLEE